MAEAEQCLGRLDGAGPAPGAAWRAASSEAARSAD